VIEDDAHVRLRAGPAASTRQELRGFRASWYPDKGFGLEGRGPLLARNLADESEILAFSFIDLPSTEAVADAMERIGSQESVRHERIDEVIGSTSLRGIFEVVEEFDFSSDETVAQGRPPYVERD
jgi:hypothetical protein